MLYRILRLPQRTVELIIACGTLFVPIRHGVGPNPEASPVHHDNQGNLSDEKLFSTSGFKSHFGKDKTSYSRASGGSGGLRGGALQLRRAAVCQCRAAGGSGLFPNEVTGGSHGLGPSSSAADCHVLF